MQEPELWEEFETHLLNESVTHRRVLKLQSMYNAVQRGLKTPLSKARREDLEEFVNRLNRNQYLRENGEPFSGSTKLDIKKFLKQFFKWHRGEGEYYPKEVSWIKARISKDEQPKQKEVVTIGEAIQVANAFKKPEFRIVTLLLFDSGFRISEMLSVRKRDITWEEFEENRETHEDQKCFWISCNQSKTELRKVPVPLFTEDLKVFMNGSFVQSLREDELLFQDVTYDSYRKSLQNVCTNIFGTNKDGSPRKMLSAHCFRHSSATHYAREYDGNMNLLADRFGWSYSSKELRTYVRKSGAYQKQGVKKVYTNELSKLKEQSKELREELDALKHTVEQKGRIMEAFLSKLPPEALEKFFEELIASGEADRIYAEAHERARQR